MTASHRTTLTASHRTAMTASHRTATDCLAPHCNLLAMHGPPPHLSGLHWSGLKGGSAANGVGTRRRTESEPNCTSSTEMCRQQQQHERTDPPVNYPSVHPFTRSLTHQSVCAINLCTQPYNIPTRTNHDSCWEVFYMWPKSCPRPTSRRTADKTTVGERKPHPTPDIRLQPLLQHTCR